MRLLLLLLLTFSSELSDAAVITFDFEGAAGTTLDGLGTGLVVATDGGISLTLRATTGDGVFDLGANGFGIDNSESDLVNAFDLDNFIVDSVNFEIVSSSVALQSLQLRLMEFDRFTGADSDEGVLVRPPFTPLFGATGQFTDADLSASDVLTVNAAMTVGDQFTLSYFAGNGFGLESITLNATTAIPEPSGLGLIFVVAGAMVVRRQRRPVA